MARGCRSLFERRSVRRRSHKLEPRPAALCRSPAGARRLLAVVCICACCRCKWLRMRLAPKGSIVSHCCSCPYSQSNSCRWPNLSDLIGSNRIGSGRIHSDANGMRFDRAIRFERIGHKTNYSRAGAHSGSLVAGRSVLAIRMPSRTAHSTQRTATAPQRQRQWQRQWQRQCPRQQRASCRPTRSIVSFWRDRSPARSHYQLQLAANERTSERSERMSRSEANEPAGRPDKADPTGPSCAQEQEGAAPLFRSRR